MFPSARGLRPQAVGERTFSPGDYDYIRQGRGHNGGLTLAYADADRTCCLTFTDDAMSGGRTSRYVKLDAPCRRLRVVGGAPAWGCKTLPVKNIFAWNVHFLPNVTF